MKVRFEIEKDGVVHSITRCISDFMRPELAQEDIIVAVNKVLEHVDVPQVDKR